MFIRNNRDAFLANIALVGVGLALAGLSSLAFRAGLLGPVSWMILLGAGLYLGYTPFNALLFDRFIAASGRTGTAGFLIYVADACGYMSSVALLVFYNFAGMKISWVMFLVVISYTAALVGLALVCGAALYFYHRLARNRTDDEIVESEDIEDLYAMRGTLNYGEGVTQIEHALQCAVLAEAGGGPPSLIVAALLHDVGHLFGREEDVSAFDDGHETVGFRALGTLFGDAVCEPVALHVSAKRYLCFKDTKYFNAPKPCFAALTGPAGRSLRRRSGGGFRTNALLARGRCAAAVR